MKNKRHAKRIYSGIKVTDNISLSLPSKKSIPDHIPLILIAFLGCIGIVNSFMSMFSIEFNFFSLNFYTVFFFLLFSVIFILPRKFLFALLPVFMIYEFMIYRRWNNYINGFMLIYNQVYKVIFPRRSDYFRIDHEHINAASDTAVFIGFTIFILTALICYVSIVKPNFFTGFLLTFPFIELGLYYGKSPDLLPIFMLIVYWTSLLSVHKSGYYKNIGRSKTGFVRKNNDFSAKPAIRFHSAGQSGIIMALFAVAIIASSVLILNLIDYKRSETLNDIRYNVKSAVSEFTFDDISGSVERIANAFTIRGAVSASHHLGNFNSVSYSGRTDLTVTADGAPIGNVYLKGYVGSVYDGKSWQELSQEIYSQNSYINDLPTHPQDILYESYGRRMNYEYLTTGALSIYGMTIESKMMLNNKYNYTPYNSYCTEKAEYIDDTMISLSNKKKYSFQISKYQDFSQLFENMDVADEYTDLDISEYDDFVYDNYLYVPNNEDTEQLYDMFIEGNNKESTYEQLKYISSVLANNAEYTLQPGRTPVGRDFVNYFLTENHKGYCVHFATAGIILARMSGIPARYAEGYVILEDDFNEENKTSSGYRINIEDNRAHAWAEIYISGYGWVPYEFTPPSAVAFSDSRTAPRVTLATARTSISKSTHTTVSHANTGTTLKSNVKKASKNSADVKKNGGVSLSSEAKLTLSAIAVIILIIVVISAVHVIVIKRRVRSFETQSSSKNALNAYGYIIKLLEFIDIKRENMHYLEFAVLAEQNKNRIFRSGEMVKITKTALEAGLSGHEISREASLEVIRTAQKISWLIFRKQNFFMKIYMKYIRNLC